MRPVDRGPAPRTYSKYRDAYPDLREQLGDYCSYCELPINQLLAVEHVRPKKPGGVLHPERETDWNNFLLACVFCNGRKGDLDVVLADYVWPDTDNSLRAFGYGVGGLVAPTEDLPAVRPQAAAMIRLVGLDVDPGNPEQDRRPGTGDLRWLKRWEAWRKAILSLERLRRNPTAELREEIAEHAVARGMFSIWMKVFSEDEDMRGRLISAFAGTARDCFDERHSPVPRPNGKC